MRIVKYYDDFTMEVRIKLLNYIIINSVPFIYVKCYVLCIISIIFFFFRSRSALCVPDNMKDCRLKFQGVPSSIVGVLLQEVGRGRSLTIFFLVSRLCFFTRTEILYTNGTF